MSSRESRKKSSSQIVISHSAGNFVDGEKSGTRQKKTVKKTYGIIKELIPLMHCACFLLSRIKKMQSAIAGALSRIIIIFLFFFILSVDFLKITTKRERQNSM